MNYNIAYLSSDDQNQSIKSRSEQILKEFLGGDSYAWNQEEGPLLFIGSGGSEQNAVRLTKGFTNITLLCHRESNSYAATIEIAAYLREQGKRASIIDVFAPQALEEFEMLQMVNQALESLSKQKAALIGEVSDWLIISDVENQLVKKKLGIELQRLPWSLIGEHHHKKVSEDFLLHFRDFEQESLLETAKVYQLLEDVIKKNNLTAISVECFSMVMKDQVTACLPLAVLNAQNIVAACEGDICSMLGKMLIRAISGHIPWQANVADIKEDTVLLAHCTAPLSSLKSFDVTTHFETGVGTAIKGEFEKEKVGVFRVNSKLDKYTLIEGDIIDTPSHGFACRTQIELSTTPEQSDLLKNKSLGNHQLIFPIKYAPLVERMMLVLEMERVS